MNNFSDGLPLKFIKDPHEALDTTDLREDCRKLSCSLEEKSVELSSHVIQHWQQLYSNTLLLIFGSGSLHGEFPAITDL